MKNLLVIGLFFGLLACKKEEVPKPAINAAAFKINSRQYVADSVQVIMGGGFFSALHPVLTVFSGNITMYIGFTVSDKGVQKFPIVLGSVTKNTEGYTIPDGTAEITKYRPVDNGSVLSGNFAFTAISQADTLRITDGIFTNIQSKDW